MKIGILGTRDVGQVLGAGFSANEKKARYVGDSMRSYRKLSGTLRKAVEV